MSNPYPEIKYCPNPLPNELCEAARLLAKAWIGSQFRPRVKNEVIAGWTRLIDKWVECEELPLYVRKARNDRGSVIKHVSGRQIVPCDNSVAHWIYAVALGGICPSIQGLAEFIRRDQIPVAMAMTPAEACRAKYVCTQQPVSLNELGWKVCHIESVGFRSRMDLERCDLDKVVLHFRKYVSPGNMFLVPKNWSGLGEMPEVIEAARQFGQLAN